MHTKDKKPAPKPSDQKSESPESKKAEPAKEVGGRDGLEPTRYGDWEKKGIISDF